MTYPGCRSQGQSPVQRVAASVLVPQVLPGPGSCREQSSGAGKSSAWGESVHADLAARNWAGNSPQTLYLLGLDKAERNKRLAAENTFS